VRNLNNITGLLADFLYSINMPQVAPSFGEKKKKEQLGLSFGERDFFWHINTTSSSMYRETYCSLH